MLKEANKIKGFDFIATGEVLGQRPMSQTKRAITLIEKELNMEGKILRPLSAKLLKETFAEKKGFIKREKLFGFEGKSRKGQMKIAKEFHLKEYPSPCGGCILTEKEFAKKLKELFKLWREKRFKNDIELLKVGRHFRLNLAKIVIGRNEKENKKMEKIALKGDILIKMKNYQGPLTLVRFYEKRNEEIIKEAKKLTKYYSTKSRNKKDVLFEVKS
jgi:tRNA U34 2-thiouridine synthase MnmA/TrmU